MSARFDKSAETWDEGDIRQLIARKTAEAIEKHIPLAKTMRVMDFGAGTGLLSFRIAPHVASVTAVDTSPKMLEVLSAKNSEALRVETFCCDITKMPLEEKYDGVISSMAMHHVEDTAGFFRALSAHLNPGGFIAIADLEKEDGSFHSGGTEGVFHFGFDREELASLIVSAGFTDVTFHHVLTIEKAYGDFPVFLVTARKKER